MSGFIRFIVIICLSFTFSSAFYLLFSYLTIFPAVDDQMVLTMLVISISITILMFGKNLLPIYHPIRLRLLELGIVIFVLLMAGILFNMFPFTWYYVLFVSLSGLLTYIGVMVVAFWGNMLSAQEINSVIAKKKRRISNE